MVKPATEQINKVGSKNNMLYIYQTKKKTFNS